MKILCVTFLFFGIFQSAIAADYEKPKDFPIDKSGIPHYLPGQDRAPDANEVEEEFAMDRKDFGVTALGKPESDCSLSFQIFVMPSFGRREYCVSGKLFLRKNDASGSAISLRRIENEKVVEQHWSLTNNQAIEVLNWFGRAEFLDSKTPAAVPASVADGVALGIEGYINGRNFKILRNAFDSPKSQEFYRCVDAFRIWKAPYDQKTVEPTAAQKWRLTLFAR
jgi:hypothetical protein